MKTIDRRVSKLEDRIGITHGAPRYLVLLMDAGQKLGPDEEAYIRILDEAGLLHTSGFGVVDLSQIPNGLNAEETERLVRENGATICDSRRTQTPMHPVFNVVLKEAYKTPGK